MNIPLNKYSNYKDDKHKGFKMLLELKIIRLTLRFAREMYCNIIRKKINKIICKIHATYITRNAIWVFT